MELTWEVDVGEHSGYIPLQFLKENRYSNDILINDSKQSRPDKTVEAKMVCCIFLCQLSMHQIIRIKCLKLTPKVY